MGLLAWIFRPSGPTHGRPSYPFLRVQPVGYPWSHQYPLSAWQVRFGLENSNLFCCGEVAKFSILFGIIGRVPRNTSQAPPGEF
jgi:hypothetical protein